MNYYAAPMEGLTDRIWRQAHQRWFGAPEAPVRYYAPFLLSLIHISEPTRRS